MFKESIRKYLKKIFRNKIGHILLDSNECHLIFRSDQYISWNFRKKIVHEPLEKGVIKDFISEGDLVFDIGANIGQYAFYFSSLVGKNGNVVSYEPVETNFEYLRCNQILNKRTNISLNQYAIGEYECSKASFYVDQEYGGRMSSLKEGYLDHNILQKDQNVRVSTLKIEIEKYGIPSFIKIDVEGFELEVVKGLGNLDVSDTVFMIETRWDTFMDLYKFFEKKGFSIHIINEKGYSKITSDVSLNFANLLIFNESSQF